MSCSDCGVEFGFFSSKHGCVYRTPEGDSCTALLCASCADKLVLPEGLHGLEHCQSALCRAHFEAVSSIDFSRNFDVYGPEQGTSVVLVHGSAGSRRMWTSAMIQTMTQRGCRVFSLDLPGHGARYREKLTLETAIDALKTFHDSQFAPNQPVVWIGNSLGGYVLMGFLGHYPELVRKTMLCGCSQDTSSASAGFKARAGLVVLGTLGSLVSQRTLMKGLLAQVPPTVDPGLIEETMLRSGAYFSTSHEGSIEILRAVNPAVTLLKARETGVLERIWFISGDLDHHDSIDRWAQLSGGKSILYPEVDHFFSHDVRSMDQFHNDIIEFLK